MIQEFCCFFFCHSALQSCPSLTTNFWTILIYGDLTKEVTCSLPNWVSALESGEKPGKDKLLLAACGTREHAQAPACSLCHDPHRDCIKARHKHKPFAISPLLVSSLHASALFALWIILDPKECQVEYLPHRLDVCYCSLMSSWLKGYEKHWAWLLLLGLQSSVSGHHQFQAIYVAKAFAPATCSTSGWHCTALEESSCCTDFLSNQSSLQFVNQIQKGSFPFIYLQIPTILFFFILVLNMFR